MRKLWHRWSQDQNPELPNSRVQALTTTYCLTKIPHGLWLTTKSYRLDSLRKQILGPLLVIIRQRGLGLCYMGRKNNNKETVIKACTRALKTVEYLGRWLGGKITKHIPQLATLDRAACLGIRRAAWQPSGASSFSAIPGKNIWSVIVVSLWIPAFLIHLLKT